MPELGDKYVCGGREFWCVGVDADRDCVIMRSGPSVITPSTATFEKVFHRVGALDVGSEHVAKASRGFVVEGRGYTVTDVNEHRVVLDGSNAISLHLFAALF